MRVRGARSDTSSARSHHSTSSGDVGEMGGDERLVLGSKKSVCGVESAALEQSGLGCFGACVRNRQADAFESDPEKLTVMKRDEL
jgi:hypothetical protein